LLTALLLFLLLLDLLTLVADRFVEVEEVDFLTVAFGDELLELLTDDVLLLGDELRLADDLEMVCEDFTAFVRAGVDADFCTDDVWLREDR
jgi:hypothetical protein